MYINKSLNWNKSIKMFTWQTIFLFILVINLFFFSFFFTCVCLCETHHFMNCFLIFFYGKMLHLIIFFNIFCMKTIKNLRKICHETWIFFWRSLRMIRKMKRNYKWNIKMEICNSMKNFRKIQGDPKKNIVSFLL